MKRSVSGEPLWRDIKVRIYMPGQKDIVWRNTAKPKRGFSAADIDAVLERVNDWLEKNLSSIEFRMVELAPNRYNFIYHGRKEQMTEKLNGCPEVARSPKIAETVCAIQGHKLTVFQNGMQHTQQGPVMQTINFCTNCGLSLAEVRGDLDARIDAAVNEGIQKRLAAAASANKPEAGKKIVELPPGAAVQSAS